MENRGKWRKLVAKSSVVLQRPSIDDDDETRQCPDVSMVENDQSQALKQMTMAKGARDVRSYSVETGQTTINKKRLFTM